MSYNYGFDRPDDRLLKIIENREEEIKKLREQLQGGNKEKDLKICEQIRNVMLEGTDPEGTEHLTAALLNMRKVMILENTVKDM